MSISIHTNAVQMTALRSLGMASDFTKSVEARTCLRENHFHRL